ncbi:MAG: AAA family ATPase [Sulfitobacter sp.]
MVGQATYLALRDGLLMQAALVDDFLPRDLLQRVLPAEHRGDILLQGQLLSALHERCTAQGDLWQLRPIDRRKQLSETLGEGALPDTEISAALKGESIYAPETLEQMIADAHEHKSLSAAVTTLEQAGPAAPGHALLVALSSKLDHIRKADANEAALGDGFVGREPELARLVEVLDTPQSEAPLRSLHIQGLPGVGKTFLIEELTRLCRARPRVVLVRLDFDRSALSAGDAEAIFDEISRQIGAALPDAAAELHTIRLRTAERRTKVATPQPGVIPFDLLHRMIDILEQADKQLVLLLDTLEVLHGAGATFAHRLLSQLDRFSDKQRLAISVISAGRGEIFGQGDPRLRGLMHLNALDADVAEAILAKRGVPADQHARIIELSGGNPLRLILVARSFEEGIADTDLDGAENGYLYRAILSRVPTDIRAIAAEGLVLPQVGLWELEHIIGPALEVEISAARAQHLLDQLENQRWMIRKMPDGRLAHTHDVRREILELTYAERPDVTRRINTLAAQAYASTDPVLTLYHQLQLSRDKGPMPDIEQQVARQLTPSMMEDLPSEARDAVLRAIGRRSQTRTKMEAPPPPKATATPPLAQKAVAAAGPDRIWLRAHPERPSGRLMILKDASGTAPPDSGGLDDLRNMLDAGEWREATYLTKDVFAEPFEFAGEAALLALTHQWRTGHWSMAKTLFDVMSETAWRAAIADDPGLTGLAMLEIWAEFRFDGLCKAMAASPDLFAQARDAVALAARIGIKGGALAFAQRAVAYADDTTSAPVLDPYLVAVQTAEVAMIEQAQAIRAEFGLFRDQTPRVTPTFDPADYARDVAPLNPYVGPLRALVEDLAEDSESRFMRDVVALGKKTDLLGVFFANDIEGVDLAARRAGSYAADVVDILGALGLTAEWTGGYAFFSPIPDLPTIVRAAQRWQEATLGKWRYGASRPEGWEEQPRNALTVQRAEALLDGADTVSMALEMIRIWDSPADYGAQDQSPILKRRVARIYDQLLAAGSLAACFDLLEGSTLPTVLHAPLAALATLNTPATDIF